MNVSRLQVSLGSLAIVLCLSLPMGILSLLTPATTGDQVDAADVIVVARVASLQHVDRGRVSIVEFEVEQHVAGERQARYLPLTVAGRAGLEVGDTVLAMLDVREPRILGTYQLRKNARTLSYDVVTPVTGMYGQAIVDTPPIPLRTLVTAIRFRLGMAEPDHERGGQVALEDERSRQPVDHRDGLAGVDLEDDEDPAEGTGGIPPDQYEPNNTLDTRTEVFLDPPVMITGNPMVLTGLTITSGDIDFFSFEDSGTSILHAETRGPEGATSMDLDSFMGLFSADTGELLEFNDDINSSNPMSRIIAPLEQNGTFSVAVESAPDEDLAFDGTSGTTTGFYELALELEQGSYLSNDTDIIIGLTPDGTFIEDFIGFKQTFGEDALLDDMTGDGADAWALRYDVPLRRGQLTTIYGGAGDSITDPGFTDDIIPFDFSIGPFVDSNGFNPNGAATSGVLLPLPEQASRGMGVRHNYTVGVNQNLVMGEVRIRNQTGIRPRNVMFTRVMDVNLFGPGTDKFYWLFEPTNVVKVYPVALTENVGTIEPPAEATGNETDDLQIALQVIVRVNTAASSGGLVTVYPCAYNYVVDWADEFGAVQAVGQSLSTVGMTTYCIAVDQDPETGRYSAFGVGLGQPTAP